MYFQDILTEIVSITESIEFKWEMFVFRIIGKK